MPLFYFKTADGTGATFANPQTLLSQQEAIQHARKAVCEMAADALPNNPMDLIAVEVLDEDLQPMTEVRLLLEVIPKPSLRHKDEL